MRSDQVAARLNALDYGGIVGRSFPGYPAALAECSNLVLIVGSFYPCIYYGFYCEAQYQVMYLSLISIAGIGQGSPLLGSGRLNLQVAGAAYIVLNPEYRKPTHRGARTKVFCALGLAGVIPVVHGLFTHGFDKLCYEMGFAWLLTSAVLYLNGALL